MKPISQIFDGRPYWLSNDIPQIALVAYSDLDVVRNSHITERYPRYDLRTCELKFIVENGYTYRDLYPKAMEAIFEFIRTKSVYQNAAQVLHYKHHGNFGYVAFQVYVQGEINVYGSN